MSNKRLKRFSGMFAKVQGPLGVHSGLIMKSELFVESTVSISPVHIILWM